MKFARKGFCKSCLRVRTRRAIAGVGILIGMGAVFPAGGFAAQWLAAPAAPVAVAQAAQPAAMQPAQPAALGAAGQAASPSLEVQPAGSISGSVTGPDGVPVIDASVALVRDGQSVDQTVTTNKGQFSFASVAPGAYSLTIAAAGFKAKSVSVGVQAGLMVTPRIALALAPVVTTVKVVPAKGEVVRYQMQQEEKQRILGFVPNYFVSYYPHAAPLNSSQKFQLTWKADFNPFTLGLTTAFVAGEQKAGMYSGYGNEEKSFAKRFGAAYATLGVGTVIGDALLPSILKQDPRFYYKAHGSVGSKLLYAITRAVICKGDNGRWEPDYSAIIGHFAAGGIANLYLPPQNRKGAALMVQDGLIGIGFNAFINVLQEFVIPKLTPGLSQRLSGKP